MKRASRPFAVEVKRSRQPHTHKPVFADVAPDVERQADPVMVATEVAPTVPAPPERRVLPAIDDRPLWYGAPPDIADKPRRRRTTMMIELSEPDTPPIADPVRVPTAPSPPPQSPPTPATAINDTVEPTTRLRSRRLPRSAFDRADRWMHRLPFAVQERHARKKATRPAVGSA